MASLNDRNQRLADAQHRAERLIAIGGDRGMARQIAAMEFGLLGGDRIELEGQKEHGPELPLLWRDDPGIFPDVIPGEKPEIPSLLPSLTLPRDRGVTSRRPSPDSRW